MDGNLSAADIMAMTKDDGGMTGLWNNPFIYLVWIWAFKMFGNGFGGNDAAFQGGLTRSDLFEGFNNQSVNDKLDSIIGSMTTGFAGVNSGLAENRFAQQSCCCETNRNIDAVRAENYKNTCEITNAIHAEGEATRALITDNTIQALRDKLADKDRDVLYANLQLSQKDQNEYLLDALRPVSRPAYITCSPYTTTGNYCSGGYASCGA